MYNSTIIGTGDNIGGIVGNAGDYNNETYIRLCSVNGGSVSGANKVGGINCLKQKYPLAVTTVHPLPPQPNMPAVFLVKTDIVIPVL